VRFPVQERKREVRPMRLAQTIVAVVCLSVAVHVIDAAGWANLGAAPLSGGDPVPCTGGQLQMPCTPKQGRTGCLTGNGHYDPNSATKTHTQKVTEYSCKAFVDCEQPAYSPAQVGCIQFP